MNRIKIIKRANVPLPPNGSGKKEAKKVVPLLAERRAAQVVTNWIDNWRAQKSSDARRAFADLFARASASNL